MDLSRIGDREKLKPKKGDEPHWMRLRPGCFLGFRPSKKGGKGTWFARVRDFESKKNIRFSLGDYGSLTGNQIYVQAKKDAEEKADTFWNGGLRPAELVTVGDACRLYASEKPDAAGRFERHVYPHALSKIELDKLKRHHLALWRKELASKPAIAALYKEGPPNTRERSPSSVNREMAPLRAALNKVLKAGTPNTNADWQSALKPFPNADRRRDLYLTKEQRRELLNQIPVNERPFFEVLCLLPIRPGALSRLKVGDYNPHTREVTIEKDKNGKPRKFQVSSAVDNLFKNQSLSKLPTATLLMRSNGKNWDKNSWKVPIYDAAIAAGLPTGVCAYTLRHSCITDLVNNKLPLLTIAQISGTSVEMIEKHYGHLVSGAAVTALESLAL